MFCQQVHTLRRVQIARVLACTYMPTYEVPEIVVAGTYSVVKWLMKCAGAWHVST